MSRSFINKEVAETLDIKPSAVAYYTNNGFVKPEIDDPKGRGTRRRYSKRNLVEILLILELQKHGMSLPKIKEILGQAKNYPSQKFNDSFGREFKDEYFNLWDALNFDDPIIRKAGECFIIIYDDADDLKVQLEISGRKKTEEEISKLSVEEQRKELKRFMSYPVNMFDHDSALIINLTSLWKKVSSF